MKKPSLLALFPSELLAVLIDAGFPEGELRSFYGDNLFVWIHRHLVRDFSLCSDLPKVLRTFLVERFSPFSFSDSSSVVSSDGTEKFYFLCEDGLRIETVYLPYRDRKTICVSSQVGCRWRCEFCYTGKMGFKRNLSADEILAQVYEVVRRKGPISHVVFMGMGEPLDNYDAVLRSIRLLNHPKGQHIGMRRITISTVGIIPAIERLLSEGVQVNLAISLHNPIPEEREKMVPAERVHPLRRLLPLLHKYYQITRRQITFEYVVLPGVNDTNRHARRLTKMCRGWDCKINLIPYNQVGMTSKEWKEHKRACARFKAKLHQFGLSKVTVRSSRGWDVAGGCGQLGARLEEGTRGAQSQK